MFNNIGSKIKSIAVVFFTLEIIGIIISALVVCGESFLMGAVVLIGGFMCAYLSVFLLYAFGELVENSAIIAANTNGMSSLSNHPFLKSDSSSSRGDVNQMSINYNPNSTCVQPLFKDEPFAKNDTTQDYWVCSNCGRTNYKTASTCGCGQRK